MLFILTKPATYLSPHLIYIFWLYRKTSSKKWAKTLENFDILSTSFIFRFSPQSSQSHKSWKLCKCAMKKIHSKIRYISRENAPTRVMSTLLQTPSSCKGVKEEVTKQIFDDLDDRSLPKNVLKNVNKRKNRCLVYGIVNQRDDERVKSKNKNHFGRGCEKGVSRGERTKKWREKVEKMVIWCRYREPQCERFPFFFGCWELAFEGVCCHYTPPSASATSYSTLRT